MQLPRGRSLPLADFPQALPSAASQVMGTPGSGSERPRTAGTAPQTPGPAHGSHSPPTSSPPRPEGQRRRETSPRARRAELRWHSGGRDSGEPPPLSPGAARLLVASTIFVRLLAAARGLLGRGGTGGGNRSALVTWVGLAVRVLFLRGVTAIVAADWVWGARLQREGSAPGT